MKITQYFLSLVICLGVMALTTGCKDTKPSGNVSWSEDGQQVENAEQQADGANSEKKRKEGPYTMKMSLLSCVLPVGWFVSEENSQDHVSSLTIDRKESGTGRRLFGISIRASIGGVQSAEEKLEGMLLSFRNSNARVEGERIYGNVTYKLFQYGDSDEPHAHLIAPMPSDPRRGLIDIDLNTNDPDDPDIAAFLATIKLK